jgi:two-component system chemotaxis response regulator CheB
MVMHPCPVVMVSSLTEHGAEVTLDALQLGAVDFVAKPGGAISLAMDEFGPILVDTVRAASKARLRRASRLTERVRLRAKGGPAPSPARRYAGARTTPTASSWSVRRPGARRPWTRCWSLCRRIFPGRS